MGIVGTLEFLSDQMRNLKKPKKKKIMKTVALKVRMDCEGCVQHVKNVLSGMKGNFFFHSFFLALLFIFFQVMPDSSP